jgi:hypothetical protein
LKDKDAPLQAFIYFFEDTLHIDSEMGFRDVALTSDEKNIIGELGDLFGSAEPKAAIIWKPYDQADSERQTYKYNEMLNDYVRSFVVEGQYFYMGSIAGVPILLDILAVDQLQMFYNARFDLAGLNNLKLNSLTFLLIALAERWDRRKQTETRNELYSKVTQFQSEMGEKQITEFLRGVKSDIHAKKTEFTVLPKKVDLSFWLSFILGGLVIGILMFAMIKAGWL